MLTRARATCSRSDRSSWPGSAHSSSLLQPGAAQNLGIAWHKGTGGWGQEWRDEVAVGTKFPFLLDGHILWLLGRFLGSRAASPLRTG